MPPEMLKVGELARRTGLTVRTLHHYDEIGLLTPSHRGESGHRLYTSADIARLQRVASLRHVGFSLEEIGACLDSADFSPIHVVEMHLQRVREQLALQRQLEGRLDALALQLRRAEEVSADEFLAMIEGMTMIEQLAKIDDLYTPEQKQQFAEAAKAVGPDEINAVQDGWMQLLPEVRANLNLDPASAEAQALGQRWDELFERMMRSWKAFPDLGQAVGDNYKAGKFEGFAGAPQSAEFAFIEKVKAARPGAANAADCNG